MPVKDFLQHTWHDFFLGFLKGLFPSNKNTSASNGAEIFAQVILDAQTPGEPVREAFALLTQELEEDELSSFYEWYDPLDQADQDRVERAIGKMYAACKDGILTARLITRTTPPKEKGDPTVTEKMPVWEDGREPETVFLNFWRKAIKEGPAGLERAVKLIEQDSQFTLVWKYFTRHLKDANLADKARRTFQFLAQQDKKLARRIRPTRKRLEAHVAEKRAQPYKPNGLTEWMQRKLSFKWVIIFLLLAFTALCLFIGS